MKSEDLTLQYWFSQGWQTYSNNTKSILTLTAVVFICGYLVRLMGYLPYGNWIRLIFYAIGSPPLIAGYTYFCLRLTRGTLASPRHFLAGFSHFGRVWLTNFLLYMIFAPLLIPGIPLIVKLAFFATPCLLLAIKYSQSVIIILDKELSPLQAFKLSGRITHGYKTKLFVLYMLLFGLAVLLLLLFIGLQNSTQYWSNPFLIIVLVLYPLYMLVFFPWWTAARATAYDALNKLHGEVTK